MLVFWSLASLIRNSVVLAVYLLFSVVCFFTVYEHSNMAFFVYALSSPFLRKASRRSTISPYSFLRVSNFASSASYSANLLSCEKIENGIKNSNPLSKMSSMEYLCVFNTITSKQTVPPGVFISITILSGVELLLFSPNDKAPVRYPLDFVPILLVDIMCL